MKKLAIVKFSKKPNYLESDPVIVTLTKKIFNYVKKIMALLINTIIKK